MAYVVTEACRGEKFKHCVEVCPVDAFHEGPEMLYIDPEVCIDCNACLTECPVQAIYPDLSVPPPLAEYVELNAREARQQPAISEWQDTGSPNGTLDSTSTGVTAAGEKRRFAVVGAGPAGFYAAEELLRQLPGARVDLFERLPTPFGLVRYGVAPDHPKIKSVSQSFDRIARTRGFRFFGNLEIGRDLSRDELLAHYDAVLYATGGPVSRELKVPGAGLGNIHGASALVGWYNGHPDFRDLEVDLSGETALVVGMGNVALDVARMLIMPVEDLARTDMADYALEALRGSRVREVCLMARRGPAQAAFTPNELRQLMAIPDLDIIVEGKDLALDPASQDWIEDPLNTEARQNLALLREASSRPRRGGPCVRFIFNASPQEFAGIDGRVTVLNGVRNLLVPDEKGDVRAVATDRGFQLETGLVVTATGYRGAALPGVAFDEAGGVIPNRDGRVLAVDGNPAEREYVAGWIKRGASGVIGSNKQCAVLSVANMVADMARFPVMVRPDIAPLLETKGLDPVSFDDWQQLDRHERERGQVEGRPRRKESDVARMLAIIQSRRPSAMESAGVTPAVDAGKTHFRTCTLCEAMCGLRIDYRDTEILAIAGDPEDPHSRGHICPKGYALQDLHNDPDRLKTPIKRVGDAWVPIGWDEALAEVARNLVQVQAERGNDAVGAYWGNPTAHNMGLMLSMGPFRSALRSRNLFSASSLDQMPHQLTSLFMYGHAQLFTIPDIDRTDYMLMLGANPAASNGSLMSAGAVLERLQGISKRGGKVLLIDPRRTETALYADEHHFIRPGTDALFLLGLLQVIIERGMGQPGRLLELVNGWDQLRVFANRIPLDRIALETGIGKSEIVRIATEFATARRAVCYGRMGVSTQAFGALSHWLIQVLNIVTGNLDREGGMMFSTPAVDLLAMAGRGGFDRFRSRIRGLPEFSRELPTAVMAEEMLQPGDGQIRAFVCIAGNPVLSAPNGRQLDQALSQLDFMVSVDFYLNETSRHAHIILPPTGPLEHEQYDLVFNLFAVRNFAKFAEPLFEPGPDSRSDWEIFSGLTRRIQRLKQGRAPLGKRLRQITRERMTDIFTPRRIVDLGLRKGAYGKGASLGANLNPFKKGLDLASLKRHPHGMDLGPLQPRLPERLFTKDRKIQLMPPLMVADLDRLCARFDGETAATGLVLIGRRDLRTNNSWMHNSYRLVKGRDRCALFVHPQDAQAKGLQDGQRVRLVSARGELNVNVRITEDIMPGVVSLPHGWGHDREGTRLGVAQAHPGISINDLTDERQVDALSGNAILNGVPVSLLAD